MSNNSDDNRPIYVVMTDPATGQGFSPAPEILVFWSWYETIKEWGIEHAHQMAIESARVGRHQLFGEYKLSDEEHNSLRRWLETIKSDGDIYQDREGEALTVSYNMLQSGEWTRQRAARFAGYLLGYSIQPDAWKKRLDKWIARNGKPKLQLPRAKRVDPEQSNI